MLVLSRRLKEKIVFPSINAAVEVVAVKPGVVRLGVDAPPEVKVLREELHGRAEPAALAEPRSPFRELIHLVRNRLNATTIGLALLRRQLEAGLRAGAGGTLAKLEGEIEALQRQMEELKGRSAGQTPPARRTALLVEDDGNERELLAGFLRVAGLDVVTAGDGCDALDHLRTRRLPDVMLLDMVMPRCDGPAIVRAVRGDPALAGLTIFGMTGQAPERFDLGNGRAGVNRWFRKPVNPENLLRDLHRELADAKQMAG